MPDPHLFSVHPTDDIIYELDPLHLDQRCSPALLSRLFGWDITSPDTMAEVNTNGSTEF